MDVEVAALEDAAGVAPEADARVRVVEVEERELADVREEADEGPDAVREPDGAQLERLERGEGRVVGRQADAVEAERAQGVLVAAEEEEGVDEPHAFPDPARGVGYVHGAELRHYACEGVVVPWRDRGEGEMS